MRILIIQHDTSGHAGRFQHLFTAHGIRVTAIIAPKTTEWPALDSFDALWVMGGAMQLWETEAHPWLTSEIAFIKQCVLAAGKPYFGVCFGHQLLAVACGGQVGAAQTREFGLLSIKGGDAVLGGDGTDHREVFQWHSAEVSAMPPGFHSGWRSPDCAYQTMQGPNGVHSVQFHSEVDVATLQDWYAMPGVIDDLVAIGGASLPDRLLADFKERTGQQEAMAEELFGNWLRGAKLRLGER
ncbi:type 1 glutamine amidotransferase [Roseovarius pelagicus]|uniref:Type 1 glutamine amidotransferase n=1 Tax=Roseovarius pelagicus TaxID=2980108 RepID=A0ABY6DDN7_9RHOB|nr:type 1 glutamine amidotransferase [Roseovarius pelagicus]UXX84281.1 type 1 glutamine amidotransferase [Roseovarius pelagicus]